MDAFGARLKQEREKRKISLDDVAAATKISTRFLAAIESSRFDQLPGGIFNRGFVRAYARHLGLDEEQIVADYKTAAGEDDPNSALDADLPQDTHLELSPEHSELPWKELAVLLLLLAVGVSLWKFHSREAARTRQEATSPVTPLSGNPWLSHAAATDVGSNYGTVAVRAKPTPHIMSPSAQPFQLRIIAREDSWISVSAPEGEILHQVLTPLEEKSFHSTNRIVVKAGNAGGLAFIWNGHELPVQGNEGEVKTLIFDSTGVHQPAPVVSP